MRRITRHLQEIYQISKEISSDEIKQLAEKPFRIALIGSPQRTREVAEQLLEGLSLAEREVSRNYLVLSENVPAEQVDIVISCGGSGESIVGEHYCWLLPEHGERVAQRIVRDLPGLAVALARRFPLFREAAVEHLMRETSRVNAKIAMLSAIPSVFPPAGVLLPSTAVADIVLLTKNQIMLLLKIAAALGLSYQANERLREIVPVVAGAMGWRSLARELVGMAPGGVGVVVKGAIAYAGTYVVGRGAYWFWTRGERLSRQQREQIYRQMIEEAKRMLTAPSEASTE